MVARVDEVQTVQVDSSRAERSERLAAGLVVRLTSKPSRCGPDHQQVELRPRVRGQKKHSSGRAPVRRITSLENEALPRGPDLGVAIEVFSVLYIEKGVEQAGVGDVDLGGADLAFAQILEPRGKPPHDEGPGQRSR